ncbi:MAG: hypothetical protein ACYDHY_12190 [Acidiferrobacterales bacterium]
MRRRFVYPDALPGGWDRIDAIAPGPDSDETEPGHPRLELPRGVPGRIGQLINAARGGASIAEIADRIGVTPRRVRQMIDDTAAIRRAAAIAAAQGELFEGYGR